MKKSTKNIKIAFLLNLFFSIIELVGGILSNSIAIISDSLHDFGDSLSIAVSWFLERKSENEPNKDYTYGYGRFSVLGALISTTFLFVTSVFVIYNAIPRIINPENVNYNGILILGVIGVIVNGIAVLKTSKGKSINQKAINLHLLEDVIGWVTVLITAIIMKIFDIPILDPILSVLIALFILFRVFKNLKSIFEIFLEKAPNDVSLEELKTHLLENKLIKDIHHIHLWTIDGINKCMMFHVVVDDSTDQDEIIAIKKSINEELSEYEINHCNIEFEFEKEKCLDYGCDIQFNTESHIGHSH